MAGRRLATAQLFAFDGEFQVVLIIVQDDFFQAVII